MGKKCKRIIGIVLAIFLLASLFMGLSAVFAIVCNFGWGLGMLITLGVFCASIILSSLIVLAVNLIC